MWLGNRENGAGDGLLFKNAIHGIADIEGVTVLNVAVAAVDDYTNCIVRCSAVGNYDGDEMCVDGEMTSNTNLRLTRTTAAGGVLNVAYSVVEIEGAKSIQTGLSANFLTALDVVIPIAINMKKTDFIYTWITEHGTVSIGQSTATAYLFDEDTIRCEGLGSSNKRVRWYVVESF